MCNRIPSFVRLVLLNQAVWMRLSSWREINEHRIEFRIVVQMGWRACTIFHFLGAMLESGTESLQSPFPALRMQPLTQITIGLKNPGTLCREAAQLSAADQLAATRVNLSARMRIHFSRRVIYGNGRPAEDSWANSIALVA